MADRWNDERDLERWRRERRYGRDAYSRGDYRAQAPEDRSFGDHEHDADWDHDYDVPRRAAAERGPERRDPSQGYAGPGGGRWSGYSGAPPYGGPRAANPYGYRGAAGDYGEEPGRDYRYEAGSADPYRDYEPRGARPGEYASFGFGHDLGGGDTPRILRRDRDEAARREHRRDEGPRRFFDRAADTVASWFGATEHDPRMTGPAGHRGKGPKGYRRSDQRISDDVHDVLTDDPYLDASEMTVTVLNGEVTLSGVVIDRDAKHRAERRVERVSGVDHVQNNLRIGQVAGAKPFETGNPLTSAGRGFGDSIVEAQARGELPKSPDDGGPH
ncbi:BON domain-containing protein [Phenylobacterium sp.]|uniref:BON domain-containing protein n=1 Tax=Phenylobacterium sp. TaxID=1871053 RepID=UPI002F3F7CCC